MHLDQKRRAVVEFLERRFLMANVQTGPIYPAAIWTPAGSGNYSTTASNPHWIVIHTTEESAAATITEFQTPNLQVSVNYMVDREGNVYQFVSDNDEAFDVGNSAYNIDSIGIENERYDSGGKDFGITTAEYQADAKLVVWIGHQYNLPLAHFAGNQTYGVNDTNVDNFAPQSPTSRVDGLGVTENASIIGHYQIPDPNNPSLGGGANNHYDPVNWNWYTPGQQVAETSPTYMDYVEEFNYANTPSNSTPGNNATVSGTSPTLVGSSFSDLDPSAREYAAEWTITNSSGTTIYDSGTVTNHLTSITVPAGLLAAGQTYSWQVRYLGVFTASNSVATQTLWSSYSTATKFTVTGGPNTPVNVSPSNGANVVNPVALSGGAFSDPLGGTHTGSEWLVLNSSSATVYDSGTDTTDLLSDTVPAADLIAGQTYTWQVRYEDNLGAWSGYSSPTSFTVSAGPTVLTLSATANYYLEDSADGQNLNIWNSASNAGMPNQSIQLATISKIIIDGASGGSNITLDFGNGNLAPQNRLSIFASSSGANALYVRGSNSGNDVITYENEYIINSTLITFTNISSTNFTPGTGTDSFDIEAGGMNVGTTASGSVNLSSLIIQSGDSLNIGSDTLLLSYGAGSDPLVAIQMEVAGAYNGGTWTGAGLTSSAVATAGSFAVALGYFDNTAGRVITIRPTWAGDVNTDGVINSDDLSLMLLRQSQSKTDWSAGNFNYDTKINADDWTVFQYAVAYSNGRNYSYVFAPGVALASAAQMSQLLSTPTL